MVSTATSLFLFFIEKKEKKKKILQNCFQNRTVFEVKNREGLEFIYCNL